MKKIILFTILFAQGVVMAQKKPEPFKGASKIIATYPIAGDSLYLIICRELIHAGYTIDKRDPDLLLITTEDRPVKHLNYKMRVEIRGNSMMINAQYISSVGFQFGGVKTEQTREIVKYTSKAYVTRNVFEEMISFVKDTRPKIIEFSK